MTNETAIAALRALRERHGDLDEAHELYGDLDVAREIADVWVITHPMVEGFHAHNLIGIRAIEDGTREMWPYLSEYGGWTFCIEETRWFVTEAEAQAVCDELLDETAEVELYDWYSRNKGWYSYNKG